MTIQPLIKGDCIGIFSSSSPTTPEALGKLQEYFKGKGFSCKVAPHTLEAKSFMAGPPEHRAEDLHSLLCDAEVRLLMTATGGGSAIQILPFLDFELIIRHPKIICGISDPTSILNAITYRTSIPTFHGPNGYNFGQKQPTPFTEEHWFKMVMGSFKVPYTFDCSSNMIVVVEAPPVRGPLVGGNLGVLSSMMGTPFFPDMSGKLLFIEEVQKDYYKIDTFLTQLRLGGVFEQIIGLIVGQNHECKDGSVINPERFEDLLLRNLGNFGIPVVYGLPLGHTPDKLTIPIGCQCELDVAAKRVTLLESPFSD